MKREKYDAPKMKVREVSIEQQLLSGSGLSVSGNTNITSAPNGGTVPTKGW